MEQHLTEETVEQMVLVTERDDVQEQKAMLEREHADLAKRIKAVVAAIEAGGDAPSLIARLRGLEARRNTIASDAAALRPVPRLPQSVIADRLADWRRMLRNPTQGRAVLQRIVKGRIVFTPTLLGWTVEDGALKRTEPNGYTFEAQTRF